MCIVRRHPTCYYTATNNHLEDPNTYFIIPRMSTKTIENKMNTALGIYPYTYVKKLHDFKLRHNILLPTSKNSKN